MIRNAKWEELTFLRPLSKDEEIIFITRQHPVVITVRLLSYLFIGALMYFVSVFSGLDSTFFTASMYLMDTVLVLFSLVSFHNYYLSMQILTNERLLDIDQTGIVKRELNEVGIENIQNINYKQRGLMAVIFGYGDVIAETAGTNINARTSGFVFEKVSKPRIVMDEVVKIWHSDHNGFHDHAK